ncbi:Gfo/Idh/MocA family oxidoreductase [Cryobacterium sp. SO2]|uniref:Gfo/Idh/MocA family oxidoreductase n=1 Tax=Cryobacterium sp. SO2 TaxID=1897060 RepID=UPI00223D65B5|nr:Gfo/Idh/MocA family oxidoreductase [Cryobacterium sp. SO2]WEO78727.1 Gfo/Idh/MocA family oxidoreductase [Cryobacterium sp. SO2]
MLNVAFIGNGKSTNRYHAPFVLARPDKFHIKTIYGRSAPSWALIPGVEYVSDPEAIWADDDLDLVIITTTSPESHAEFTRTALERGKNVLVEKPFSPTAAEARELFELANEKGLFVQGFQNRRFDSDFLTVKEVLARGVLGDLLEVEMHYDYYRPETSHSFPPSTDPGFSFLFGHGVHTIDQALSLFGSPDRIHYDVRQLLGPGRANDYFDVDLYYGTLKVTIGSSFFRLVGRPRFTLYGTTGTFVKVTEDRQEEHLKMFAVPGAPGFGVDSPAHYGTLSYVDEDGGFHEEKVVSQVGDYSRFYDGIYESLVNGAPKVVKDDETIELIGILEEGLRQGWVPATVELLERGAL